MTSRPGGEGEAAPGSWPPRNADRRGRGTSLTASTLPLQVPWDDLRYLFGEIMYGGHITDDWDRRLCRTYLAEYIRPEMLEGDIHLAPGFQIPPNLDYKVSRASRGRPRTEHELLPRRTGQRLLQSLHHKRTAIHRSIAEREAGEPDERA